MLYKITHGGRRWKELAQVTRVGGSKSAGNSEVTVTLSFPVAGKPGYHLELTEGEAEQIIRRWREIIDKLKKEATRLGMDDG